MARTRRGRNEDQAGQRGGDQARAAAMGRRRRLGLLLATGMSSWTTGGAWRRVLDAEHPMDITMSRVHLASDTCHIYFMHTKVNHLLYTCSLVPFEDGILLDIPFVCIHRYCRIFKHSEDEFMRKRTSTPSKREAWKRRRKRQEEGSSSQAPPCAWAPSTPCPRASQAGGPEDPVHTGVYRTYGTPVSTGLTDPVRTGPCVRSLDTSCARAPLTPCTRAPCVMLRALPLFYHFAPTYSPLCLGLYILVHLLHLDLAKMRSKH